MHQPAPTTTIWRLFLGLSLGLLWSCDGPLFGGQEGEDISTGDVADGGSTGSAGSTTSTTSTGSTGTTQTSDGGSTGSTGPKEGVARVRRSGSLQVAGEGTAGSATGTETLAATGSYGAVDCAVTSTLHSTAVLDSCTACTWAFELTTSDSVLSADLGCDLVAVQAADFDGQVFEYGLVGDGTGGTDAGTLYYGYLGAWYPVADVTAAADTFSYDWVDSTLWSY